MDKASGARRDGGQGGPKWGSRFGFLMAAIGSAVGLGNLWRFPFQAGQNGGGAFVLTYILCVALIAYPVLIGELAIGRHKGLSAVGSTKNLSLDSGHSSKWQIAGWIGFAAAIVILPSYAMISGQIMAYAVMALLGDLHANKGATPLYNGAWHSFGWFTAFLVINVGIVMRGVNRGIEAATVFLMPIFFVLLVGLAIFALSSGASAEAISYLFSPRFYELTPQVALAALGQAFFSVGVGAAIMITYGSFLSKDVNIATNAAVIAGADTLVALVAGLLIFPIVFAHGMDPAAGTGLIFGALPAFFFLAFIAALTSSISILMMTRVIGIEQFGLTSRNATVAFGFLAWLGGIGIVTIDGLGEKLDWLVGSVLMPLGALTGALLAGWIAPHSTMRDELRRSSNRLFAYWRAMMRFVVPVAILAIFITGLQ
ncbi:MAG: sodium-dependent transporter [Parvularculaceae bacterium]|nr:sodium-dependent transporter [Parvularculaceae bacterium]